MKVYTWEPAPHGHISVKYSGREIGQAIGLTQALAIETKHRLEKENEAYHLFHKSQQ